MCIRDRAALGAVDGNLTISSNTLLPLATAQAFATSIMVRGTVVIN